MRFWRYNKFSYTFNRMSNVYKDSFKKILIISRKLFLFSIKVLLTLTVNLFYIRTVKKKNNLNCMAGNSFFQRLNTEI